MSFAPTFSLGNFVPESITLPEDPKELQDILKRILEAHAKMINRKETGAYEEVEVQNNQQYFGATPQSKRQIYRKVIAMGALLNAAPTTVAHLLNGGAAVPDTWRFVRQYGWAIATATPLWIPIPNGGIHDCSLQVTATQVIITPTVDLSAFDECYVVLELYKA